MKDASLIPKEAMRTERYPRTRKQLVADIAETLHANEKKVIEAAIHVATVAVETTGAALDRALSGNGEATQADIQSVKRAHTVAKDRLASLRRGELTSPEKIAEILAILEDIIAGVKHDGTPPVRLGPGTFLRRELKSKPGEDPRDGAVFMMPARETMFYRLDQGVATPVD